MIILCGNTRVMKNTDYKAVIAELLKEKTILSVEDFREVFPDVPEPTLYARIRALVQDGSLSVIGKGKYTPVRKPTFRVPISPWMEEVNMILIQECVGIYFCMIQRGDNLYIQASKQGLPIISAALHQHYHKVIGEKDARKFPGPIEGFIILEPLVSESPVQEQDGISVPTLEKELIDGVKNGNLSALDLQKYAEVYPLNQNRLQRYAVRRGVSEEVNRLLASLNQDRIQMMSKIQKYLEGTTINKAWVFGSFARGEETPQSDVDILVDYGTLAKPSLLTIIRYKLDLEKAIGREVDIIENGYLKPFAAPSAERDKYIIYERAH